MNVCHIHVDIHVINNKVELKEEVSDVNGNDIVLGSIFSVNPEDDLEVGVELKSALLLSGFKVFNIHYFVLNVDWVISSIVPKETWEEKV